MYNDVSLELRNKIRMCMKVVENANDDQRGMLHFFLPEEQPLIDECREWLNVINKYFKTTYNYYKLAKVGRFYGVRPIKVYYSFATFTVDDHDELSWRDWFDLSGYDDGPLLGQVGIIKNKRSEGRTHEFLKYT